MCSRRVWCFALVLLVSPLAAFATLERAVAGLVDRAADRPVDVSGFRAEVPRGQDFSCWNGCPYVGSQNIPVVAAAASGDYEWVAALSRWERREGLYGSEIGSPGWYYSGVQDARMVALRDARRAYRLDLAGDIALALRASWAWDALTAIEGARTSAWADLGGDGVITGPGNTESFEGLTVAVAGNRWNGSGGGERWLSLDSHSLYLTWALDWPARRADLGGIPRNPRPGRGSVPAFLGGVDDYAAPIAARVFGLTEEEREVLRKVVRGDAEAARTAAAWLADFGVLRKPPDHGGQVWGFTLTRTTEGTQSVFWGPHPNPAKPPHAATAISTAGEWRTIRPSRWGRRAGETVDGYEVRLDLGEIVASVAGLSPVRMPRLGGALLWEIEVQGANVAWRMPGPRRPGAGLLLRPNRDSTSEDGREP